MAQTSGKISEGTIVEIVDDNFDYVNIEFPDGQLPEINDALVSEYIASDGQKIRVRFIVEQILDEYTVRAFTMSYADGLTEGMKVVDARELVNKEEKTKEQKDRVWSNLFVGIILMAIGLVFSCAKLL